MIRLLGVCLLFAAPLMSACGPMQSTAYLYDADIQLEAARTAGAAEKTDAVYYWTLANLYIHQAREEVGYSHYESAVDFARKAKEFAIKAKDKANGITPSQKDGSATAEAPTP